MTIKKIIIAISCLFSFYAAEAQKVKGVYKTDELLKRISNPDTLYVVNFWATWCKPCIQELPAFDSLNNSVVGSKVKVLLVNLDFTEDLEKRVNPFLQRKNITTECVLLDEVNGNVYIDRISKSWSGAIPATYFKKDKNVQLSERKFTQKELQEQIVKMQDQR